MAQVSHPNVVAVYDVGTFEDQVFLAMEYVDGETLRQWLSRTMPQPREIVDAYVLAGRGLEAAHGAGHPASRLQARERAHRPGRAREGPRLRARARGRARGGGASEGGGQPRQHRAVRDGARPPPRVERAAHPQGHDHGHAGVHGARAAPGRGGDGAQRSVRVLRRPLRGAARRAPVRGGHRHRARREHPCGARAVRPQGGASPAARATRAAARPSERPRGALRLDHRSAARAPGGYAEAHAVARRGRSRSHGDRGRSARRPSPRRAEGLHGRRRRDGDGVEPGQRRGDATRVRGVRQHAWRGRVRPYAAAARSLRGVVDQHAHRHVPGDARARGAVGGGARFYGWRVCASGSES